MCCLWEENIKKLADAGGLEAWELLSDDEKDRRDQETYDRLCRRLGDEAWEKLSTEAKEEAALYIWTGCCMHKEMNGTKGGATRMGGFWSRNKIPGPLKLFNHDNAAAVAAGPSTAHDQAMDVSQGGAIKLALLAGMLFNHKDNKKGLQDTYRIYFECCLGYAVHFPDTRNTHFQSHLQGATELLIHLPLYIDLMLEVKDNKEKGNFNHLELNMFNGLHDTPTLMEMAALTLYLLTISYSYMRVVRGSGEQRINTLDLVPLHDKVKNHCQAVIDNPDLLLAQDASFETGSFDGKPWERADAFYTVQRMAPTLPYLRGCLIDFFEGALETWEQFGLEFEKGRPINGMTEEQKKRLFTSATNDHNEGALSKLCTDLRCAPNMSLTCWNAGTMYKCNRTHGFMKKILTQKHKAFLCSEVHRLDSLKLDQQRRQKQAEYNQ